MKKYNKYMATAPGVDYVKQYEPSFEQQTEEIVYELQEEVNNILGKLYGIIERDNVRIGQLENSPNK